jgi:zinc/manganese transport system substrate-binding protein
VRPAITRAVTATAAAVVAAVVAAAVVGCSSGARDTGVSAGPGGSAVIQVVAAENFWGSIAQQLGGAHAAVTSIISNPDTDPHSYEPTPQDARTIAQANVVIVNGIGYDTWATKLVAANPNPAQLLLDVGHLAGVPAGGNPHQWYAPTTVHTVVDRVTQDYKQLDPTDAAYFDKLHQDFLITGLAEYDGLLAAIKATYAGTPVGGSESIVSLLAQALGLDLLTPSTFLTAISEGSEPSAADKTIADRQIATKQIKVFIYNSQNSTPDVQTLVKAATTAGIPVPTITETLTPAGATFQQWQVAQLRGIQRALAQATGK